MYPAARLYRQLLKATDVAGRHFAFKYKLALGISAVILVLLAGVFLLIESFLRSYVTAETEEDLVTTRALVSRLLEERRARLHELGTALAGDARLRPCPVTSRPTRMARSRCLSSVSLI